MDHPFGRYLSSKMFIGEGNVGLVEQAPPDQCVATYAQL